MDVPYEDLDPGIRAVVRLLADHGFRTTDSGDGVSKVGTELEGCMDPIPNVTIRASKHHLALETDAVVALLESQGVRCGVDRTTLEEFCGPQDEGKEFGDGVLVEGAYYPLEEYAVIFVTGLDDDLLARCQARLT